MAIGSSPKQKSAIAARAAALKAAAAQKTPTPVATTKVTVPAQALPTPVPTTAAPAVTLQDIQNDWMSRPYSQVLMDRPDYSMYDPATAEYLKGLDAYVKNYGLADSPDMNPGGTVGGMKRSATDRSRFGFIPELKYQMPDIIPDFSNVAPGIGGPIIGPPRDLTTFNSKLAEAVSNKTPYEQLLNYGFAVGVDEDQNTQWANVNYNTPIALVDNRTGKVVASGTGFETAKQIADLAQNLTNEGGRKASWGIYTAAPGTTDWKLQASDTPDKSVLGSIASIALPALGALVAGPIGLGGTLGAAGGAAAGSALSGTLQGQGIGDILKNAAIAGATTLAGGELMKGIGGATQPSAAFKEAFSPEFVSHLGDIAAQEAGGALGGAATGAAGMGSAFNQAFSPDFVSSLGDIAAKEAAAGSTLGGVASGYDPVSNVITAVGSKAPSTALSSIVSGGIGGLTATQLSDALNNVADATKQNVPTEKNSGLSTLDKIRLGLLGSNLLSGIIGGSGNTSGTSAGTGGPLNYTALNRTQNTPQFDVFTYGQDVPGAQQGEYQFFSPAATKLAEGGDVDGEPSDDMVKHLLAYQRGGGHMGPGQVKGIGSGQEDKIPAWLSDGEYVWSAQDVADLGDGSTDEGVRRLDKMRQMVRKQAGRKDVKKIAKPQKGIDHMLKAVGGRV